MPLPPPPRHLRRIPSTNMVAGDECFEEDNMEAQLEDYLDQLNEDVSWDAPLDEEVLEFGEISPPDVYNLAKCNPPHDGPKPGNLLALTWICPKCMEPYTGSCNYICNIQTYRCKRCNIMNPTAYDWTLTRCYLNGTSLDFSVVYDQKQTLHCVLYAFIALCDMMRRVRGARFGCDEGRALSEQQMHRNYAKIAKCELGKMSKELAELDASLGPGRCVNIEVMLMAGWYYGVPYNDSTDVAYKRYRSRFKAFAESYIPFRPLEIAGWFRVSGKDIETIVRLVASGIPLIAVVPAGKRFDRLPADQIYHAPKYGRTHTVVLHGTALAMPHGAVSELDELGSSTPREVFFRARNSHGSKHHAGIGPEGGADICVWASDIVGDVYGIQLADRD